jgi:hypothetical protein
MDAGNEKRRSIRVTKPFFVQFGIGLGGAITWDMTLLKDVSETGMCIRTASALKKDDVCCLRFRMPLTKDTVAVSAKVVDSLKVGGNIYLTRLEFLCLGEKEKKLLRDYVEWTLTNERGGK